MRVFIGLTEISGYGANLKRGLEALGIDAVFLDLTENPFRTPSSLTQIANSSIAIRLTQLAPVIMPHERMMQKLRRRIAPKQPRELNLTSGRRE